MSLKNINALFAPNLYHTCYINNLKERFQYVAISLISCLIALNVLSLFVTIKMALDKDR